MLDRRRRQLHRARPAASRSRSSAATTRPRTRSSSSARTSTSTAIFHLVDDLAGVFGRRHGTSCAGSRRSRRSRTTNWFDEQRIVLAGRRRLRRPDQPPGRQGLPGPEARAVQAPGPARRRGRRHRRRPLAQPRPQAAGREGRPAVQDRHAAARVEADRRPEHLQRRLEGRRRGHDDLDHALRASGSPRISTSARRTRAATRRRSASRRSSPAASASAASSSSTASSTPTAPSRRSRSSTSSAGSATTGSTSRARSIRTSPVKMTGTIIIDRARRLAPAPLGVERSGRGIDLTRPQPFDWKAQGFLVGQPVHISGFAQTWVVVGFSDDDLTDTQDNTRMHLERPGLTPGADRQPLRISSVPRRHRCRTSPSTGGRDRRHGHARGWRLDHRRLPRRPARAAGRRQPARGRSRRSSTANKTLVLTAGRARRAQPSATRTVSVVVRMVVGRRRARAVEATTVPITIQPISRRSTRSRTRRRSSAASSSGTTIARGAPDGFHGGPARDDPGHRGCVAPDPQHPGTNYAGDTLRLERGLGAPDRSQSPTTRAWSSGPARTAASRSSTAAATPRCEIDFEMDCAPAPTSSHAARRPVLDRRRLLGRSAGPDRRATARRATIIGFVNSACPFGDPFPGCGLDSTMQLSADVNGDVVNAGTTPSAPSTSPTPEQVETTALMNITVQPTGRPRDCRRAR